MEDFAPELNIFADGDQLVVVFDTLMTQDHQRLARIFKIPISFETLSFALEGFDESSSDDTQDVRTIRGRIILTGTDVQGQEFVRELAQCHLVLPAMGRGKNGAPILVPVQEVEHAIRQGMSRALQQAFTRHYATQTAPKTGVSSMPPNGFQGGYAPHPYPAVSYDAASCRDGLDPQKGNKSFRFKLFLALVVPLLLTLLIWLYRLAAPSPVEQAVAQVMSHDPASVAAQVELTKQTLQQMGLDPGQNGDLGCLAPQ